MIEAFYNGASPYWSLVSWLMLLGSAHPMQTRSCYVQRLHAHVFRLDDETARSAFCTYTNGIDRQMASFTNDQSLAAADLMHSKIWMGLDASRVLSCTCALIVLDMPPQPVSNITSLYHPSCIRG
jgi:hypothetical protein